MGVLFVFMGGKFVRKSVFERLLPLFATKLAPF